MDNMVRHMQIWACFLSLAQSKLRLYSANHWAGYFSNLACDWLSIVWAYSEQETENGSRLNHFLQFRYVCFSEWSKHQLSVDLEYHVHFDICSPSLTVATPAKYEYDSELN